jgi:ribonucleoside-diphosphate reductase alpha chain
MTARWLNKESRQFLSRGYLQGEQTAEERIREIAEGAERYLSKPGFADKFEQYVLNGWVSMASPVWANFATDRGLPISCNGVYVDDTMDSILHKVAEVGMQTKEGAGTSGYLGALRHRGAAIRTGGESYGPVHFLEMFETITNVVSQSNVRRGSFAAYLDIEHPDIKEFLTIREENSPMQKMSFGVCVTDKWMEEMVNGDKDKRKTWASVIRRRFETGYPYIFYTDNVNNARPQVYKDKGVKVHASNLCTEIMLPSSEDESFVCCLSSLNLLYYLEWKDTDVVETLTYFLDAVLTEYINKTLGKKFMEPSRNFSINHRAIGVGILGWHSFLQSQNIAFESSEARDYNVEIFKTIDERTLEASKEMAILYGEPPMLKGYGLRNTTRMAVAPTTSSSFILGQVSPSSEPENSNYYTKDLAKGKHTYKNPWLKDVLKSHKQDNPEVWRSILVNGGSVQHLSFLSEHEKNVFKTFGEIAQIEIITQAAARQLFIDQGQSINLMVHPEADLKDVNNLMIEAWKLGIKSLYYQRSTNPAQQLARSLLSCESCEA